MLVYARVPINVTDEGFPVAGNKNSRSGLNIVGVSIIIGCLSVARMGELGA